MARSLRQRALVVCALALTAGAISLVSPAIAGAADLGFKGPNTSGNSNPTAEKPESKLWFNDGIWWGALWDSASPRRHEIFRLDTGTQTWTSTNVPIDSRAGTHVDALWDGTKLYVASHIFTTSPKLGGPSNLYRYSYNAATDTYTLDPGFPAVINSENTEALVIDRDSFGNLWATWMRAGQVRVSHTSGNDAVWGAPFVLPTSGAANATTDDMSSLIAFSGRIGVMYSNQNDDTMHFAVHVDGAADSAWTHENAYGSPGSNKADDHINLKTFGGKVYAATKTSLGGSNPLVNLLVRDANGIWTDHLFGTAVSTQDHTRPIVLIDATSGVVHMFATGSSPGSTTYDLIYEKTSPLANISFAPGAGTPFIDPDGSTPQVNNATSTKQNLTSGMGLVVIASGGSNYWHNTPLVPDTTPPVIQSAVANGSTLTMTYSELLNTASVPAPGAFAVTGGHSVTGVNVTGTTVVLTLAPAVTAGETGLTLSYTKGTNPIEDLAGNDADNLTDAAVTNNTPPVDGTNPVFQSAAVNGSALTMTYNEALNTGSVPANGDFTISAGHSVTNRSVTGSTVVLTISPAAVNGEVITLSYTKGTNPIEDLAGNDADNLTDAAVTNNTPPPGGGSLTLRPNGDGAITPAGTIAPSGTVTLFDAIDEPVATSDNGTTYVKNNNKTSGSYFAQLTDTPAAFALMQSLTIDVRARTTGAVDDQTTLFAQVFQANGVTPLTNEVSVATNPGPGGFVTISGVTLTGLTGGSKAIWDGAQLRLRWAYTAVGTQDTTQIRVSAVELDGTF